MADVYPAITDVRGGVTFGPDGAQVEGTLDLPAVGVVVDGTIFDATTKEGSFVVPAETDVRRHTTYGDDEEFVGTLIADPNPDPSLTLVYFDKPYPPWNLGEICGFSGEALTKLLAAGIVKPYTP